MTIIVIILGKKFTLAQMYYIKFVASSFSCHQIGLTWHVFG